jgi:hypothetical protein
MYMSGHVLVKLFACWSLTISYLSEAEAAAHVCVAFIVFIGWDMELE